MLSKCESPVESNQSQPMLLIGLFMPCLGMVQAPRFVPFVLGICLKLHQRWVPDQSELSRFDPIVEFIAGCM